jgi:hypothetical protein
MNSNDNNGQNEDRGHIYGGWAARPVDNSFWIAANKKTSDGKPSLFAQRAAEKKAQQEQQGPAPSNG